MSADDADTQSTPGPSTSSSSSTTAVTAQLETTQDRSQALSQARAFLLSPQVIHQSPVAKRHFLAQKGLSEHEITSLLQQMPPSLPPPTYPQPPPSRLLPLLLGFCRIFTWVIGSASVLLLIYHRFLLPRVLRTVQARVSLKQHQISLLKKLNERLETVQAGQREAFSALPPPLTYQEPEPYASCETLQAITSAVQKAEESVADVPTVSLVRCGIVDALKAVHTNQPTTEELFQRLEASLPWKPSEFEATRDALWKTLTTSPLFTEIKPDRWFYNFQGPYSTVLIDKLQTLSSALPDKPQTPASPTSTNTPAQRTLQSLTAFTGYLSSQIYTPPRYLTPGLSASTGGVEEDIRKEIRALKGLALNRRSFLPPRPSSAASIGR